MEKRYLKLLSEKLNKLSFYEKKKRDLYLRKIANGELYGPCTNYSFIDKPWLKYYPEAAIESDIPKMKAYNYVYENNKEHLEDVSFEYLGNQIKYREFFENVEKTARAFKAKGIKQGDIVTMAMATTPEMVYILYALNRIGACVNAVNPILNITDIINKAKNSSSKMIIGLDFVCNGLIKYKEEIKNMGIVSVSPLLSAPNMIQKLGKIKLRKNRKIETWEKFIEQGATYLDYIDSDYVENEPIIILYTGGTTGEPKGVILTNENLNAMAFTQIVSNFNLSRQDTFLNFLPPFSAYSIVNAIHDPLVLGFKTILVPKFKEKDFPKLMLKYKPNHVLSGPILWDILIKSNKCKNIDLSSLKSPISGGDSLSLEEENLINEYLKSKHCNYKIQQGYGMTEVSAAACYSSENSYHEGSVGIPYVKNNITITDIENDEFLQNNTVGKIGISTPTMMKGYYNNEMATNEITHVGFDGNKVIDTGDIGFMDSDGHLFVIGRLKRLIVRSGKKISPMEIENLLLSLPEISMCLVVGAPDEKEKSVPVAHIVLKNEYNGIPKEKLIKKMKSLIVSTYPNFMIPKYFVFRSALPLTQMTKIDFVQLELESAEIDFQNHEYVDITDKEVKIIKKNI